MNKKSTSRYVLIYLFIAGLSLESLYSFHILSDGSFNIFQETEYSLVFWDMWNQFLHLSLQADPAVIKSEGFLVNGATYAYQLPLPAFVRGFLSIFGLGASAIASVLLANLIFIFSCVMIFYTISPRPSDSLTYILWILFLIFLTICPTILVLMTYPRIFTEVIIWGLSIFMVCMLISIKAIKNNSNPKFVLLAIVCGLTLFTRPTFALAAATLFFLTVLSALFPFGANKDASSPRGSVKVAVPITIFLSFCIGVGFYNFQKWGEPLIFYPVEHYIMFKGTDLYAEFLAAGGANQINRVPEALGYYFFPTIDNFLSSPPFIHFGYPVYFQGLARFNYDEPAIPLTVSLPIPVILFLLGSFFLLKDLIVKRISQGSLVNILLPSIIASAILVPPILTLHAKASRYQGEFLPIIFILGTYFIANNIEVISRGLRKYIGTSLLSLIGVVLFGAAVIFGSLILATASPLIQNTIINKASLAKYLTLGEHISFARSSVSGTSGLQFLVSGWQEPEAWGTWSSGRSSLIIFPPVKNGNPKTLKLKARALIDEMHLNQEVDIYINSVYSKKVVLKNPESNLIEIDLDDPRFNIKKKNIMETYLMKRPLHAEPISVQLNFPLASTPSGQNFDKRILAVGLISAAFE